MSSAPYTTPPMARTTGTAAAHRLERRRPHITAQHAQRRHARELQQRGQRKTGEHRQRHDEADQRRPRPRRRQIRAQQPLQYAHQPQLRDPTGGGPDHARDQRPAPAAATDSPRAPGAARRRGSSSAPPHPGGAARSCARSSRSTPRTAAPRPGSPAPGSAPRAGWHRRSAGWHQPRPPRARAPRRIGCASAERQRAARADRPAAARNSTRLPGWSKCVAARSASLISSAGASSTKVAFWSGREIRMCVTRSMRAPTVSSLPRPAPSAAARRESGHASPGAGIAAREDAGGKRAIGDRQLPAQRIALADGAHVGELIGIAVEHRRQRHRQVRGCQAEPLSPRPPPRSAIGCVGFDPQVGRQHLACLQRDRAADAIDQEAHAGQCGHRDAQRQPQHRELARAPLAPQRAQRQQQTTHQAWPPSCHPAPMPRAASPRNAPASIDSTRPQRACERAIVRDQHQRGVRAAIELEQQLGDALTGRGVEIAGGLIGKQHHGRATEARARATRCCSPPES